MVIFERHIISFCTVSSTPAGRATSSTTDTLWLESDSKPHHSVQCSCILCLSLGKVISTVLLVSTMLSIFAF